MQKLLYDKDVKQLFKEVQKLMDEGYVLVRSIQDLYCPTKEDEEYVPRSRMYVATMEKRDQTIKVDYDEGLGKFVAQCGFYRQSDTIQEAALGKLVYHYQTFFNMEITIK